MKILLATPLLTPDIGGPATYAKILLEELPKHGIAIETAYFGEVRDKQKIIRHLAYFYLVLKKAWRADIIYALDPVSVGLPSRLASFLAGKKFMVRIAGDYAWEQGTQRFGVTDRLDDFLKRRGYGPQVSLLRFVQFVVAATSIKVIVPSNYFKGVVVGWGVREDKVKTIYSVFEGKEFFEDKETIRQRLGLSGTILLSSGRLVPWKGFLMLLELMSSLKNRAGAPTLYIAGSGPQHGELEAQIKKLNLERFVVLLGQLAGDKLASYVRASDVFLLNTSYEGFSHQLLEVMAIGTPIITTPVGGNVELIEDGVSGLFAPFDDKAVWLEKIKLLVANTALQEKLVLGAKAHVAQFTTLLMIDELMEEFEKIK